MKDLTRGGEARNIFLFSLPMLIGNLFQQLYNMVDGIVVGRYVGAGAFAAVGTAFPVMFLMLALIMGLSMGASIVVSQFFGAQKMADVRRSISTTLVFLAGFSVVLTLVGYFGSPALLRYALNVPEELMADTLTYVQIICVGAIFTFFYNGYASLLRALGDSKTPLYFLAVTALLNVGLDILFVVSFGWGVAGVAWATVISQIVSCVLCVIYAYHKVPVMSLGLRDLVFDRSMFKLIVKFGIPSCVQQTVLSIGFMAMQRLVNSFGTVTMAAYSAASRVDQLAMMPMFSFNMALSTFVSQNVGANRYDRVRRGFLKTILMTAGTTLVLGLGILLFADPIISIFISDTSQEALSMGTAYITEIFAQARDYLSVVALFYIIFALMSVIGGLLRGAGDVTFSTVITIVNFGFRLFSAYLMAYFAQGLFNGAGYRAIWWSLPIGWFVSLLLSIVRYASGRWKTKAVVRLDAQPGEGAEPQSAAGESI